MSNCYQYLSSTAAFNLYERLPLQLINAAIWRQHGRYVCCICSLCFENNLHTMIMDNQHQAAAK